MTDVPVEAVVDVVATTATSVGLFSRLVFLMIESLNLSLRLRVLMKLERRP